MKNPPSLSNPQQSSFTRFATERLQLAIFLHATGRLAFSHCEAGEHPGKLQFVFNDPEGQGTQAELEFDRGESCPATALFASQKYLRRKMSEALNNLKIGEMNEYRNARM